MQTLTSMSLRNAPTIYVSVNTSIRQKAYKTTVIQLPNGETDTGYSVRAGDVWVGSLKSEDKPE